MPLPTATQSNPFGACATTSYDEVIDRGRDPLTRPASADEDAVAGHPLPQGGEGGFSYRLLWGCLLLPTADCRLPTADCLLPTAYCLLPTAFCLHTFSRAISKSRMMSCQSSRPRETRIPSGCIPKARFWSSGSAECVIEKGCSIKVFICPRLTARVME